MKGPSSNHHLIKLVIIAEPIPGRKKTKENQEENFETLMQMLRVVSRIVNWYSAGHSVLQWSLRGNTTEKVMESVSR